MTKFTPDFTITRRQMREARAILAWSRKDLCDKAAVAPETLTKFERGSGRLKPEEISAIENTLETQGIYLHPKEQVTGPPIPWRNADNQPFDPIRGVTADDLRAWAGTSPAPAELPNLITKLIYATCGQHVTLRFPADGGINHPGWDGVTDAKEESNYVPQGQAGWELTNQSGKIAQKFGEDYAKRSKDPEGLDPASSTFIFVTLNHWGNKQAVEKEKKANGPWKDVRIYDVNDLVHWIEQHPAVGLWLATHLGKRRSGWNELGAVWEEWSGATKPKLTEELLLCDRDTDAAKVLQWLREKPSLLSLQAETSDEVVCFFHATLSELPHHLETAYRARCLVVTTSDAGRALAQATAPLILILTEPDPGLASILVERGHFVLLAYDGGYPPSKESLTLRRPSYGGIAYALMAAGIAAPDAHRYARDIAGNFSILRRRIPSAPGRIPSWAKERPPNAVIAALLAGSWNTTIPADKTRIANLAGFEGDADIESELTHYVGQFDHLLRNIGTTWRLASPYDAWFWLARFLRCGDIDRFEEAAMAVFDPSTDHSNALRRGIGHSLILLSLLGERVRNVSSVGSFAGKIVRLLLENALQNGWFNVFEIARSLAEASPSAFLKAIETDLNQDRPLLLTFLGHEEGAPSQVKHLTEFLWAMEILAWSPDYFARVSLALAHLATHDTKTRRLSNGPANSLSEIYCLSHPQTSVSLDDRLIVLDRIRAECTDAAWHVMLGILPKERSFLIPSPMPRWRDFSNGDAIEEVTAERLEHGAEEIGRRLLEDVGANTSRWISLLGQIGHLRMRPDAVLKKLDEAEIQISETADREQIWKTLREILHDHRMFAGADWCFPKRVLDQLDTLYNRFEPADLSQKYAYLFNNGAKLPNPPAGGWESFDPALEAAQIQAVKVLIDNRGIALLHALVCRVELPATLGEATYQAGLYAAEIDDLIEEGIRRHQPKQREFARQLIILTQQERGETWGRNLLTRAKALNWGDTATLSILCALPLSRETWEQISNCDDEMESAYWTEMKLSTRIGDSKDAAYAIGKLCKHGRARDALKLIFDKRSSNLPTLLIINALRQASRQPPMEGNGRQKDESFDYIVTMIFEILNERIDIDPDALMTLEWCYLERLKFTKWVPRAFLRALNERPSLFVNLLRDRFPPSNGRCSFGIEPENRNHKDMTTFRTNILFSRWKTLPGTHDDGTVDEEALKSWVEEARSLAQEDGLSDACDFAIGKMLSASPLGDDDIWPALAVRQVLDYIGEKELHVGFVLSKSNRHVPSCPGQDIGEERRSQAAQYRTWNNKLRMKHPDTASLLEDLAMLQEDGLRD